MVQIKEILICSDDMIQTLLNHWRLILKLALQATIIILKLDDILHFAHDCIIEILLLRDIKISLKLVYYDEISFLLIYILLQTQFFEFIVITLKYFFLLLQLSLQLSNFFFLQCNFLLLLLFIFWLH